MPDINDELFDALARNQKEIKSFIDIETQLLVSSFSSISEYSQESLKIKATGAQEKITGKLLDFNFISSLFPDKEISDEQFRLIKYTFRQTAEPLSIPFALPVKRLKSRSMQILALSGAVIGMYFFAFLTRIFLGNDYREFGILAGGPLGAYLFVLIGGYLSEHQILLRSLQGILGVATVAEVLSLFVGAMNPIGIIWKTLTHRFGGGGFLGTLKRLFGFILAILILQLAVPGIKLPKEQLVKNARDAMLTWYDLHYKLLVLIIIQTAPSQDKDDKIKISKNETQFYRSLMKLANCKDEKETAVTSNELIQSFKNIGYDTVSKKADTYSLYNNNLQQEFDVEGFINENDEYEILEVPLYKDDELIIRGKIMKKRSGK